MVAIPLLILAGANYALGSHRLHAHGHRAHGHLKHHAEMIEPRDVAWLDAQRIPDDIFIEVHTLTKTVFEDCAPTNTIFVTTTLLEDWVPAPAQPKPTNSEPTHYEIHRPHSTSDEPTTTILLTTTVTDTVTGTVSVSVSITAPASSNLSVEERPMPEDKKPDPAPQFLPTLGQLPQLLPGIATAIPDPLLQVDQALNPNGANLPSSLEWTSIPKHGAFSNKGFGGRSPPHGTQIKYRGNVGIPWGSNIISVSPTAAHAYKYVVQFTGSNTQPWTIIIWNKVGPSNKMDGWYGHSALTFILAPGETRYVAFDEDSEGAWGAAPGTDGLPTDHWGGYTSTWGEFTFGDVENDGWSGWDVSAIQAQIAHGQVQGMRICDADGQGCSIITPDAEKVVNAYTESKRHHDGIGGAAAPGPVRLLVDIDYRG